MDSNYNKILYQKIRNRQFDICKKMLKDYLEKNYELNKCSNPNYNNKIIEITYNNNFHKTKIFTFKNEPELLYKIIENMFCQVKFLIYYDWNYDQDIYTNLSNILLNNDSLTVKKRYFDLI